MDDKVLTPAQRNYNFQKIIAVVGAILMLAKFFAYILTNSVSILTDAAESIVNVVAGFIGLYALYLSMKPADRSHPYGHGKVELISATTEGSLIIVAGAIIIIETVERVISGDFEIRQLDFGLVIVAAAAVVNFAMGYTAIRMGRGSNSLALEASGRHLCSDTYSSVGILIGLGAVYGCSLLDIDANWLDPLLALVFGCVIIYTGIHVLHESLNGIMDSTDMNVIKKVTTCLNHVHTDEIIDVHHLRVVRYGAAVHVDAHMTVPGSLTVSETESIVQRFREETIGMLGDQVDITFMAEACNERFCCICPRECPRRKAEFKGAKPFEPSGVIRSDSELYDLDADE